MQGSDLRPRPYKEHALTTELMVQCFLSSPLIIASQTRYNNYKNTFLTIFLKMSAFCRQTSLLKQEKSPEVIRTNILLVAEGGLEPSTCRV
jgi:hypothetical protein